MRVLVTWGSKLGGTEGIARIIAEQLRRADIDIHLVPAIRVRRVAGYDAAIVGGALYANRWHRDARRLIARNIEEFRRIPVWLFSSGPLDDSAERAAIPPTTQVAVLAERIGAVDHVTFGGRLEPDVRGFPAAAMAVTMSGDWRSPERIRAWADEIVQALPAARPRPASEPPARAAWRVAAHATVGWMLCALVLAGLLRVTSTGVALALHAIAAPAIFVAIASHYFRPRGAREPLPVALAMTAIVALLDAVVVAGLTIHSFAMFASIAGTWLPFAAIFVATWLTGLVRSTMPWPKPTSKLTGDPHLPLGA